MTDRIAIRGIRGFGYHGVFAHEREQGQEFIVDVDLGIVKGSGSNDQLDNTVDYGSVAERIHAAIVGEPFALIEALAQHIADQVMQIPGVIDITVTVHKPQAPIAVPFDNVSITIRRP